MRRLLESDRGLEDTIRRKFEELSSKWQAVQDAHDVLMAQPGQEGIETEPKWIYEMMTRYENIEIDADAALMKFKTVKQSEVAEQNEARHPIHQAMHKDAPMQGHLQLERLKLETFDIELRK